MIIHQPEVIQQDNQTIVWAKIELGTRQENFPDFLWFRFPEEYSKYICLNSDAFLAPGLIAAMHFGEDVQVRGTVSPKLAYHLDEFQYVLNFWMPKDVSPVSIQYERLAPAQVQPQTVGCTFSGGVDSWFTIWKHLPQNQPLRDFQVTNALFINLFDLTRRDKEKYPRLYNHYHSELQRLGIDLIPLETNLASLVIPRLRITYFFAPILAGCAMLFQGLLKRFFIASGRGHREMARRLSSSSPLTERLLSTDTLDLIHYGSKHQRYHKIEIISNWQLAQENLRVCVIPNLGEQVLNCSRCEKCLRTMVTIYALGSMAQFSTFVKPFTSNLDILLWARKFSPEQLLIPEFFKYIKKINPDLLPWLRCAVLLGSVRYHLLKIIPVAVKKWLQRFGYYIDPLKEENAFENLEIIQVIHAKDLASS